MRSLLIATVLCSQLALGGCAAVMTAAATHATVITAAADMAPLALFAGAVGTVGIIGAVGDDRETFEPGTFGAFLQGAEAESDRMVEAGMKNQREVLVASGLQIRSALTRARIAYRGSLGTKDAALGAPERNFETTLASTNAVVASGDDRAVKEAGDRAQAVADSLRLPDGTPQLQSAGPRYLFSFLPFQTLSIRGTFPASYKNGALPQLTVNGKAYAAFSYSADSLDFSVNTNALIPGGPTGGIGWNKAELSIPWEQPLFGPLGRDRYRHFVVIGVLPDSPGRATIDHAVGATRVEERARTSEDFALKPQLDPGQTRCLQLTAAELAEGWRIVKGSGKAALASFTPGTEAQDHGLQSEDDASVCWSASAAEDPTGKVPAWKISARIRREVADSRTVSETFDMKWGENRTFAYPSGTWHVRYSIFNRGEKEVDSPDLSNPFVHVASDGRSMTLRTYPF
jgi:hypothetical protein